jgi:serine/threonine protein kinase
MVTLAGYDIFDQIYAGSRTLVYRGERQCDRQPVILKFLNRESPSFSELLQFRNQYAIAKNLDLSGIVRPYSLESYRNSYALVMEDFGGISLNYAIQLAAFTLAEILSIAVQLAGILYELPQNRVIHKDIKPANIVIHPESKQVKLIDFSIASLLELLTGQLPFSSNDPMELVHCHIAKLPDS